MSYIVNFKTVSQIGFETSPVAAALAGLRANEARYFHNKYKTEFATTPVSEGIETLDWVSQILKEERNIIITSKPLETASILVDGIKWVFVFYESGLSINVLYTIDNPKKRAVGFKLSEGMDIPEELSKFKFARQKSKLAGIIRGSFFVIKKEY